jgi:hypothetical protein
MSFIVAWYRSFNPEPTATAFGNDVGSWHVFIVMDASSNCVPETPSPLAPGY